MRALKKIAEFISQKIKKNNFLFRCEFKSSKFCQFNIRTIDSLFNENLIVLKRNSNFSQSKSNYLSNFFLNKIFINKKINNNSIKIKILKNVFCFPGPSFNCKAIYFKNNNLILSEGFDLKKEKLSLELHYENNQENMFKLDIKKNAFYGCSKLTTINVSNATSIGDNAFNGCSALTTIHVPKVTSIGKNAFSSNTIVTKI